VGPSTGLMQSDTHGAWQLKAEKYTRYLTTRPERLVASSPKFQAMRQDPVQNSQAPINDHYISYLQIKTDCSKIHLHHADSIQLVDSDVIDQHVCR
jgi:uncharacterized protein YueI